MSNLTKTAKAETVHFQKIMLKHYYTNETDIPDNLKGAYQAKNGRYELINLADDVPIVATNKSLAATNQELNQTKNTLTTELETAKTELQTAKSDLTAAQNKTLQNGQRAVSIEVADLGNAAKEAGFSKEDIPTVKTKLETFEQKETQAKEREDKTKAFQFAGVMDAEKAFTLKATDDLKFEWREVDGKSTPYLIGEKDGQKTETLFDKKYIESADGFKEFKDVLFAESEGNKGFQFPGEDHGTPPKNIYDDIRNKKDAEQKEKAKVPNFATAFGGAKAEV